MRAVLSHDFSGPAGLTVGDAPAPTPAADEVLIDVRAASVSFMDKLMCEGGYQMRPDLPYSPGTEAAGVVLEVGADVTRFKPGDRIAAQLWFGGQAELCVAKHWKCAHVPDNVDFATASTVLHNYLTAWCALVDRCALAKGETLFVTGSTGGVGLSMLDMGRMLGARVIAGIGDDSKADVAHRFGAQEVINYRSEDLRERLKEVSDGHGIDVGIDMLGGEVFMTMARRMAWGGRLVPVGFVSGDIPQLPMNLPLLKNFSVVGVFMGRWADKFPDPSAQASDEVMRWVSEGKLHPEVAEILPLDSAGDAMLRMAERSVTGRIVLETSEGAARG